MNGMRAIHPGEILREEFMQPLSLSSYRLAKELHVTQPRVNDLVLEKRGVTADMALLIAMECRLCGRCRNGLSCPVELDQPFDTGWGSQRIVNLIGAWHNQLIEVMGAMGMREARRLRGEVGRSMWFEDLERDHFGPIFGERKVSGLG